MRILVTGSKGVVGAALARHLEDAGHEVWGVDRRHAEDELPMHHHLYGEGRYVRADVAEYRQMRRVLDAIGAVDLVYHAAAEFGRWNGEDRYEDLWRTNMVGTRNLIELQQERRFRCVYFSSSEVYGDMSGTMHEASAHEARQLTDYGISKWANEQQVANASVDAVRVRLFNTYGPGEAYSPYRSVVCRFLYRLLRGHPIHVYGGHERSHTWLPDCVRALSALTSHWYTGQVYNIGSSNSVSNETLADMAVLVTGADRSLVQVRDYEPRTTRRKAVDNKRAKTDLGYRDTVGLHEGLARTAEWMIDHYQI